MATTVSNTTFSGVYKDDFLDSDNYHRILFNSGKALQARELTQSQTIINKEIERFGSNIFREGGAVNGGNITLNNKVEFIKLASNPFAGFDASTIVGKEFTVQSPNPQLKVKVLETIAASGGDPDTLIVEYTDTSSGTSSDTPIRVGNSNILSNSTLGAGFNMTTVSSDAAGAGTRASITEGSFFVQGHFVFVAAQTTTISKYSSTPTDDVGFLYNRANNDFVFGTNNTERMRIASDGKVTFVKGIEVQGDTSQSSEGGHIILRANSGGAKEFGLDVDTSNSFRIITEDDGGDANGVARFILSNTGSLQVSTLHGSTASNPGLKYNTTSGLIYYDTSSIRYKENVQDLPNSLEKIKALRPVTFDEKTSGDSCTGLIAEEVIKQIPDLVHLLDVEGYDTPQPNSVDYAKLSVYLLKAIQEQQAVIEDLKTRIETLEG